MANTRLGQYLVSSMKGLEVDLQVDGSLLLTPDNGTPVTLSGGSGSSTQIGLDASKPSASSVISGTLYFSTDTQVVYRSNAVSWVIVSYDPNWDNVSNGGNFVREAYPRMQAQTLGAFISSGVMYHVALPLLAGDVVTNLHTFAGTTTPSGIAHWWFALYDTSATPVLMAQTADQGSGAIANSARLSLPLTAPQTIPVSGIYYACAMFAAATPPSCATRNTGNAALATGLPGQMRAQGTSGSGLTTTAPATIASPSPAAFAPWMGAT